MQLQRPGVLYNKSMQNNMYLSTATPKGRLQRIRKTTLCTVQLNSRHPAECPCGQNRQQCPNFPVTTQLHRGLLQALLTSPHVPRQRNVCRPVSELTYMSAVDDLYIYICTICTGQPKEPPNVSRLQAKCAGGITGQPNEPPNLIKMNATHVSAKTRFMQRFPTATLSCCSRFNAKILNLLSFPFFF